MDKGGFQDRSGGGTWPAYFYAFPYFPLPMDPTMIRQAKLDPPDSGTDRKLRLGQMYLSNHEWRRWPTMWRMWRKVAHFTTSALPEPIQKQPTPTEYLCGPGTNTLSPYRPTVLTIHPAPTLSRPKCAPSTSPSAATAVSPSTQKSH